ncbi:Homeodomain-like domain protein [compost metagenome]
MNPRYRVELDQSEREALAAMLSGGKHAARKLKRAQILLAAHAGQDDASIAATVAVGESTVYRTKRRFVETGLEAALNEKARPGAQRKLSGKEEALLIATACTNPPPGRARWTPELLADTLAKLTEHEELSRETVRRRLAENDLKPWRKNMWCIPKIDAEYVACMEDVLDLLPKPRTRNTDPHAGCALPSPAISRGTPHPAADRIPLHQARQLAQHGRDRNRRAAKPVPG